MLVFFVKKSINLKRKKISCDKYYKAIVRVFPLEDYNKIDPKNKMKNTNLESFILKKMMNLKWKISMLHLIIF